MEIGFQRDDDNVEKGKGFAHKKVSNLKSDDRIFKLRNFQVEWNSNGKRATERLAISCSANEPCFASNINFMKKLKQHKIDFSHFYAVAVRVCVCVCVNVREIGRISWLHTFVRRHNFYTLISLFALISTTSPFALYTFPTLRTIYVLLLLRQSFAAFLSNFIRVLC